MRGYITGVTSTSLWRPYAAGARTIYGYHFPDGLRKNTALPGADRHADDEAAGRLERPRRAADVGRGGRAGPRRARAVASRSRTSPLELFRRGQEVAAGRRADPRRHEVRVRPHARRRAAADRRGAHAGLVAVLGRRHLRGAPRRRRGAREPRQGGRPPGPRRRRLPRRRRRARPPGRRLDGDVDPLHRRLPTAHRARRSSPAHYPVEARLAARLDALRQEWT